MAGLEIWPLHVLYVVVCILLFSLSLVRFALSLCLASVLGLLGGTCDVAILLTTGSNGALVPFKSIRFLLMLLPLSVIMVYDLSFQSETIPISKLLVIWFL